MRTRRPQTLGFDPFCGRTRFAAGPVLRPCVTPCEPGDHQATIRIGPYTYHAWANVEGHGAAATFVATLPAPPGRNTVTVSCDGAVPATFILERNPSESKLEWAKGELLKGQKELNSPPDPRFPHWGVIAFWEAHKNMAWALNRDAQYDQAKQYAAAVIREGPAAHAFDDDARAASRWRVLREDALIQWVEAAYYSGDAATMGVAVSGYIQESTDRMRYEIARGNFVGGSAQSSAMYCAMAQAKAIRMAITAGVDASALAGFEKAYLALRQEAGFRWPQYDNGLPYFGRKGAQP